MDVITYPCITPSGKDQKREKIFHEVFMKADSLGRHKIALLQVK